jgi:arylsulfatase A-like enzyme
MTEKPKNGLDRRSILLGAAGGAAATGAIAAGAQAFHAMGRRLRTPPAVSDGQEAVIADDFADSRPAYAGQMTPPEGAPNIIVIILDDVGFSDLGCYGSEIATPAFDSLAARGLTYTNFRTTAMCSPTRAALMTGLNPHSAGMGWLADIDSGYPGYRGDLTMDAATMAEVLQSEGWATFHIGKWHVNLAASNGPHGPFHNWPTSRGFDRAYWFQGHSTDYFRPAELIDGVTPVEPPEEADYYVTEDLTTRAIAYLQSLKALQPERPFFLQIAYPAAHSPLQARARDRDIYQGRYASGWDAVRAERLARQKSLGVMPGSVELPPLSPGADPWSSLSSDQRRVYARYMEVYAGCISAMDTELGRLLSALEDMGVSENTLIVVLSDNGGSAEGTPEGTPNVFAPAFGRPASLAEAEALHDVMGLDETFPHYPIGWACASNTPFRMYKQYAHLGGVADPLIVSWPARIDQVGVRANFVHVIDLYPTILEAAGVARPEAFRGRRLKPVEGRSILSTFDDAGAPTRTEQYFELGGQRAYMDGTWRLAARHVRGSPYEDDIWELYDLSVDPNELRNLAGQYPDKVQELAAKWDAAAERHGVFPLDDRNLVVKMAQDRLRRGIRADWEFKPPFEKLAASVAPVVCGFSHEIIADIEMNAGDEGVLVSHGSRHAGYVLFVQDGQVRYEQRLAPWEDRIVSSRRLTPGRHRVRFEQRLTERPFRGRGAIHVDGFLWGETAFDHALFSTSYDGFMIGSDPGNRVSTRYQGRFPFTGIIHSVRIRVDNRPYGPLETQRFLDAMGIVV